MIKVKSFPTAQALTDAVIQLLTTYAATDERKPHAVMLSGGTTPMGAYKAIAAEPFAVSPNLHIVFSDDRMVLPDSPKSNYGNMLPMLTALKIPDGRVTRVHAEYPASEAARIYGRELQTFIDDGGRVTLGLLGLGTDGHTASLFSARDLERAEGEWAVAVMRPDGLEGISATPRFISCAERVIFLVTGKEKREMLNRLLKDSLSIPAGRAVAANKAVEVWTDPEAWPL